MSIKSFLFFFSILILFVSTKAQDSRPRSKNMAIVPFMPQMYFNDLSRLWYQTGESHCQEKQIKEISEKIFLSLDDSLSLAYNLYNLDQDKTISTKDYLLEFYSLISFAYADTFPQSEKKLNWLKKEKKSRENTNKTKNGEVYSEKKDRTHQFLNAKIRDVKAFKSLCKELNLDEVLFINQVEIRGDFASPYNSGRETDYFIKIHYSLYDKNAKLILGNKTGQTTTNEKARYLYFMDHDLKMASLEITDKILDIKRQADEAKAKEEAKKKKKQ